MSVTSVSGRDRALARARAYELYAALYRDGLDAAAASLFDELPGFEGVVAEARASRDDRAARFQSLFGFAVPPFAGTFLDARAFAGGAAARVVTDAARAGGVLHAVGADAPDHVATEFSVLAALGAREARGGREAAAAAGRLVAEHVACWFPAFVSAVRREGPGAWATVGSLSLETLMDHLAGSGAARPDLPPQDAPGAGSSPGVLAKFLATHARSGLYVSSSVVGAWARALDLPAGFGGRVRRLETLLASARRFDAWPSLVDRLLGHAAACAEAHESDARRWPPLRAAADAWLGRLSVSERLLRSARAP